MTLRRLAVVAPGFPADDADTRCLPPLHGYLQALQRARPELRIDVVALHYPYHREPYGWRGLAVWPAGGDNRRWPLRVFALRRALARLRALDREQPFDALHALWLTDVALVAALFARGRDLPAIASGMGQEVADNPYLGLPLLGRFELTAPSPRSALSLRASTGRGVHVIPWGIEACDPGPPWAERTIDLLGVGSLIELKQYDQFTAIAARLASEGRLRQAVLVGDGPCRPALEASAARAGLGDRVRFTGFVEHAEALEWMRRSRVLLHPSRTEGFGLVFAEALARGMAIVSRPVGVAEAGPRWRLADSVEGLLDQSRAALATDPGQAAASSYPVADTVERYLALYERRAPAAS